MCHMLYVSYFTEFSNDSTVRHFPHFFIDAEVETIISPGAEMVSNSFTPIFPGANTGPADGRSLTNVWCIDSDFQWILVNCELNYLRKLRVEQAE